jgi:hypothetical protein
MCSLTVQDWIDGAKLAAVFFVFGIVPSAWYLVRWMEKQDV